jgi:hypothetical protein
MSWADLTIAAPDLASFGAARLHGNVAYLATTQKNGAPRVHPVTPEIGEGHFFVFMEPTSPKGKDLQWDPRYAIHCSMSDSSGESGEFWCMGTARLVDDPELREVAKRISTYPPADRYILFELDVERAQSTEYVNGSPVRVAWKKESA